MAKASKKLSTKVAKGMYGESKLIDRNKRKQKKTRQGNSKNTKHKKG